MTSEEPGSQFTEHVWDLLDRRVRARGIPCINIREHAGALVVEAGFLYSTLRNQLMYEGLYKYI